MQKCKGTAHQEGLDDFHIAMSSAEAELYAAADTMKKSMHVRHLAEEMCIDMGPILTLGVDATAAIGKIQGPRGGGRMKHIDLRQDWIKMLRNQGICKIIKVPGETNRADFFTKLLPRAPHKAAEAELMPYVLDEGNARVM